MRPEWEKKISTSAPPSEQSRLAKNSRHVQKKIKHEYDLQSNEQWTFHHQHKMLKGNRTVQSTEGTFHYPRVLCLPKSQLKNNRRIKYEHAPAFKDSGKLPSRHPFVGSYENMCSKKGDLLCSPY